MLMGWLRSCLIANNAASTGGTGPGQGKQQTCQRLVHTTFFRATVYRLGDAWELLQHPPSGDHSCVSALVLQLPPGGGQIHVHPSFLPPEQNRK